MFVNGSLQSGDVASVNGLQQSPLTLDVKGSIYPKHYHCAGRKECIIEIEERFGLLCAFFFCVLNVYKYEYRYGRKDDVRSEGGKIVWYLSRGSLYLQNFWVRLIVRICFRRVYIYFSSKVKDYFKDY